jgi:hypothetical protein
MCICFMFAVSSLTRLVSSRSSVTEASNERLQLFYLFRVLLGPINTIKVAESFRTRPASSRPTVNASSSADFKRSCFEPVSCFLTERPSVSNKATNAHCSWALSAARVPDGHTNAPPCCDPHTWVEALGIKHVCAKCSKYSQRAF